MHPMINRERVTLQVTFPSTMISLFNYSKQVTLKFFLTSTGLTLYYKQQEVCNTMIFCQAVSSHEQQFVSALQCFHAMHLITSCLMPTYRKWVMPY